jgi:hypothetical protein
MGAATVNGRLDDLDVGRLDTATARYRPGGVLLSHHEVVDSGLDGVQSPESL